MNLLRNMSVLVALACFCLAAPAQVVINNNLELNGTSPGDRQVKQLKDASFGSDALNARTEQRGQHRYATATGTNNLAVNQASIGTIKPGTTINVLFANDNTGPVQLSINGSPLVAVTKGALEPLQPGDIMANELGTLVFDGTQFHLSSGRQIARRSCPAGFAEVNELYCIQTMQNDTADFRDASTTCGDLDARLCTWGEWFYACFREVDFGLQEMTGDWEWTNNSANASGSVRMVGISSCSNAGVTAATGGVPRNFRCCYSR